MNDFFQLKTNGTTVRQEVIAGLTTFTTIAYIIFVNPAVLSKTGMDFQSVLVATCLASAIGCLLSGLLANYPFALAPGMGLNAFFVYTVVFQAGYSWQSALGIVFISGLLFILLTVTGLRSSILEAFPAAILKAIPAGIGLFIAVIGLNTAGIIDINQGPIIDILLADPAIGGQEAIDKVLQAPPQIIQFGDLSSPTVYLAIAGFVLMTALVVLKIKGAILISIVAITLVSVFIGVNDAPSSLASFQISLAPTFLQMDFGAFLPAGGSLFKVFLEFFTLLIAFTMVDLFDTLGTLYGTAEKGGFLTSDGKLPRVKRAMLADAVATTSGAVLGTSTTTTYIESGSGIAAGGRTGLTSVVVAMLFLVSIFFAPLASMIPTSATAPALIMVGVFMLGAIKKIDLEDMREAIPAFLTIVLIPLTYSIANGIGAGIIFYVFIQSITGGAKDIKPILWIVAILFIVKFAFIHA
ncbi:MAG: NCS2 family permease [Bacteroidota bacterium]